jgi:hypothetical protein
MRRREGAITKRKLRNVGFDVHRPGAEASSSAPQHLPTEVHCDDQRTTRAAGDCFARDETGARRYVQDRTRGEHVREQARL